MSVYETEVEANFNSFTAAWKASLPATIASLDSHESEFLKSYSRITTMNAWRSNILENAISEASLGFYAEALNDVLVSHVFARFGSWRAALKSLRSCIENTCYCLYYKDHPIELRLWEHGKHRPGFSETLSYLEGHPDISPLGDANVTGIPTIKAEYATLSRAVHGSAKSFRMSPDTRNVKLWTHEAASLGQWRTREQQTLASLNLLMVSVFSERLSGTQNPGLRQALSAVIGPAMRTKVKRELGVTIAP
jgi:hypothetical protein